MDMRVHHLGSRVNSSMAMLAGQKSRQKWSSDPRNTFWANDSDKFGQRMLQKMGWQPGKGLGSKQHGRTEHVKITKKDDNLGLGASFKSEDNWLAHQDDFNSLLTKLNENYASNVTTTTPEDSNTEATSLEERSKSSKKRVHYKRFTRGKDLSSYSNKDLACIMGTQPDSQSASRIQERIVANEEAEAESSENGSSSSTPSHGIVTVTSSQSLQDYFSQKMAGLQGKKRDSTAELGEATAVDGDGNSSDGGIWMGGKARDEGVEDTLRKEKKKKKKKRKKQEEESSKLTNVSDEKEQTSSDGFVTVTSSQNLQEYFAQKMAALKDKRNASSAELNKDPVASSMNGGESEDVVFIGMESNIDVDGCGGQKKEKKKKKKRKEETLKDRDDNDDETAQGSSDKAEITEIVGGKIQELNKKKKKSKKRKHKDNDSNFVNDSNSVTSDRKRQKMATVEVDKNSPIKTNDEDSDVVFLGKRDANDDCSGGKKEKRKKNKKRNKDGCVKIDEENDAMLTDEKEVCIKGVEIQEVTKKKKKSKKRKHCNDDDESGRTAQNVPTKCAEVDHSKKNKKKKQKSKD